MNQKGLAPILIVVLIAVAALGGGYLLGRVSSKPTQSPTPVIQSQPTSIPYFTPQPTVTSQPSGSLDETTNWKIFTSERCDFSVKYPNNWTVQIEVKEVEPPPGVVNSGSGPIATKGFRVSCIYMYIPMPGVNYKDYWRNPIAEDFYIYINRTLKGSIFYHPQIVINSIDDYLKTYENEFYPNMVSNVQNKTFSGLSGIYFEDIPFNKFNFIFERGEYIYNVIWPKRLNDQYKKEVELVINSIKFQ